MSNLNNNLPYQQQQYPQQTYPYMQQQPGFPQQVGQPQQQQPGLNMQGPAGQQQPMGLNMQPQAVGQQQPPNIQQYAQPQLSQAPQIASMPPQQPQQQLQQQAAVNKNNSPPRGGSARPNNDLDKDKYNNQDDDSNNGGGEDGDLDRDEDGFEEVRGRRRSKNDVEGRDHRCKYCDKTYLSYPALYTHTKQKHSTGPDGEQRAPPTSGRGRGRPRKNTNQRTDPKSEEYFYQLERRGGPVDPIIYFEELYDLIIKDKYHGQTLENYPLYKELCKFVRNDKSNYQSPDDPVLQAQLADRDNERDDELLPYEPRKLKNDGKNWKQREWRHDYDSNMNLEENTRNQMLIDETFAVYLYKISLKTNPIFYKVVLSFVIFFRECLNHIGWTKRIQSDEIDLSKHPEIQQKMKTTQFCMANTAEHAPEICNEFVTVYMEDNRSVSNIDRTDSIDLTINLCHWLFENQFTCSKLTMIQ